METAKRWLAAAVTRLAWAMRLLRARKQRPMPWRAWLPALCPRRLWLASGRPTGLARKLMGLDASPHGNGLTAVSLPTSEHLFVCTPPVEGDVVETDLWETMWHWMDADLLDSYGASNHILEGDVVLDVGANVGAFTLCASRLVGGPGAVYAVEPIADNLRCLRACVEANGLHNVSVVDCAAGESSGDLVMHLSEASGQHSAVLGLSERAVTVPKRRIDDIIDDIGISSVGFIKIDVEGYEPEVIRGASASIARFRPVIAAAAYHLPEHAMAVPQAIRDAADGYRHHPTW